MAKRRFANLSAIQSAAVGLSSQDRVLEESDERVRESKEMWSLADIRPRDTDTRKLHPAHVISLVESIRALGLIEPLVIDRKGRLLAGGHRRAALEILRAGEVAPVSAMLDERGAEALQLAFQEQELNPAELGQAFQRLFPAEAVPVRVMDLDAELAPQHALAVEIAENEQRRDYTRDEVMALAERLKAAGYRAEPGRPRAGEKALAPALQVVVGKSLRTVRYILSGSEPAPKSPPSDAQALLKLRRAIRSFQETGAREGQGAAAARLSEYLWGAEPLIEAALREAKG